METGFGIVHIKMEGAAMHPDDMLWEPTQEQWERQLAAYRKDTGDLQNQVNPFTGVTV